MSYILDALRKSSEERRKREEGAEHSFDPPPRTGRSMLQAGQFRPGRLLTVLFFCVVLLAIGFWYFGGSGLLTGNGPDEMRQPAEPQSGAAAGKIPPDNSPPLQQENPTAPAEERIIPRLKSSLDQAQETTIPETGADIPLMEELPFAIQAALPEMKFSGHVYSPTPALRMIMVNTAILREGSTIAPELKLVEITDNGLLLNYRGTAFRVVLF